MKAMLGTGAATNSFDDIEKAQTFLLFGANSLESHLSLSETQTRTYLWCSPPKSGTGTMRPALWMVRAIGASFGSDRCVRTSL